MSILNLSTPQGSGSTGSKKARIWLGVGLLAAVLGFGSTFAASITLNNGQSTEFGQGVQSTVYCGGSSQTITTIPYSSYSNSASKFYLSGIKISGIPKACDKRDFVLTLYPSSGSQLSLLKNGSTNYDEIAIAYFDDSTYYQKSYGGSSSYCANKTNSSPTQYGALLSLSRDSYVSACGVVNISSFSRDTGSSSSGNGSITLSFSSSSYLAESTDVSKIVIESQAEGVASSVATCPTSSYISSGSNSCSSGTLGLTSSGS